MKWIGLVFAIFVAAVAAFMVFKFSGNDQPTVTQQTQQQQMQVQPQAAPEITTVDVYVAAGFIPVGSVIEENMLDAQPWPEHLVLEGFVVGAESGRTLIGKVTRAPFQAREPIINSKVVNPDDPNFLAGNLPKGMRVATMSTDGISGVAGFIFPGDRVDVLITHRVFMEGVSANDLEPGEEPRDLQEAGTEILISNVRVLAVDQRASAGNEDGGIVVPQSVSLEVTPEQAQRLKLGSDVGQLSLALRSLKDKDTIESVALTRRGQLSQYQITNSDTNSPMVSGSNRKSIPVVVVRGTEVSNEAAQQALEKERSAASSAEE